MNKNLNLLKYFICIEILVFLAYVVGFFYAIIPNPLGIAMAWLTIAVFILSLVGIIWGASKKSEFAIAISAITLLLFIASIVVSKGMYVIAIIFLIGSGSW